MNRHSGRNDVAGLAAALIDRLRVWRVLNIRRLTDDDPWLGHARGRFCVEHSRWLSYPEQRRGYPEQRRGACSWCVPVDPEREPSYRASPGRKLAERR